MMRLGMAWAALAFGCAAGLSGQNAGLGAGQSAKVAATKTTPLPPAVRQALLLEQQGKVAEARTAWSAVVKAEPRNGQAFAHLGLMEAREERYADAIAHYRKAKALDPAIPGLELNLGLALFKSGEFAEAKPILDVELKKHPGDQRLTVLSGMARYGLRDFAGAIPYLKEAAAADEKNLTLLLTLAHCYLWTKQYDAALETDAKILLVNPDSAEADMIAGEALDEKGDNAGAVRQFEAAVKADPKEPNVHFGLAYLLWVQKRYDEAIPEFKAELANDPKNSQAMLYLGDTYVRQAQYEPAKPVLEGAVKDEPKVALGHLDLGIVYMETGAQEAAVRELSQAVALEPENVAAHFRLAGLYRQMGKKDEAKAEFEKSKMLNKETDEGVFRRITEANARHDAQSGKSSPSDGAQPAKEPEKP